MKHLVIEANCIYDKENNGSNSIPACCRLGPKNISNSCLLFEEESNKMCPYLVFGMARSSLVLTDKRGDVINSTSFFGDLNLSSDEWNEKEETWLQESNTVLQDLDNQ